MKHFFTELVPARRVHLSDLYDIFCIVDDRDYDWVMQWRWNFLWNVHPDNPLYARRNVGQDRTTVYLHRELMLHVSELPTSYTDIRMVDHANGQTLDCRRANLRWATPRENRRNRRKIIPTLDMVLATLPGFECDLPF